MIKIMWYWYIILYFIMVAFTAALMKVCFDLDPDDEDDLGPWIAGSLLWPLTILFGVLYLIYKMFEFLIRLTERGIKKLIQKIGLEKC